MQLIVVGSAKLLVAAVVGVIVLSGASVFLNAQGYPVAEENGLMENFQVVCLVLGMGLCAGAARREMEDGRRVWAWGLALLFLTFFVLELDIRKSGWPVLVFAFNGKFRDLWLGSAWLGAAYLTFRNAAAVWGVFKEWVWTGAGVLMVCAGVFWIFSGLIDKSILISKTLFLEEVMEVNSTYLMLLSAMVFFKAARHGG